MDDVQKNLSPDLARKTNPSGIGLR